MSQAVAQATTCRLRDQVTECPGRSQVPPRRSLWWNCPPSRVGPAGSFSFSG